MTTSDHYDYIVVGVGGIGSGALYWLSRNAPGKKILGIEQFRLGHVNGGSQDVSRAVRMCIPDAPLDKLAPESYVAWEAVERESGLQLVYRTGGLYFTTPDAARYETYKRMYQDMHRIDPRCKFMSVEEMRRRWPVLTLPDNSTGIYDPEAGIVDAALANSTHQQLAECRGAQIVQNTKVVKIDNHGPQDLVVHTSTGKAYSCSKVIVTAGAWLNGVLESVGCHIPVKVSQENVTYYATKHLKDFTKDKFPILSFCASGANIYTLPIHGIGGFKLGIDAGGHEVTAESRNFKPDPALEKIVTDVVNKYVPRAGGRIMETKVCLYTMTLDRMFVIDNLRRSGCEDVIVCCGAGHAFKFASLFGRILSELAIFGSTKYDISKLSLDRPAITDPAFVPKFDIYTRAYQLDSKL